MGVTRRSAALANASCAGCGPNGSSCGSYNPMKSALSRKCSKEKKCNSVPEYGHAAGVRPLGTMNGTLPASYSSIRKPRQEASVARCCTTLTSRGGPSTFHQPLARSTAAARLA